MTPSAFQTALLARRRSRLRHHRASLRGEFMALDNVTVRVQVTHRLGTSDETIVVVPDPPNLIEHHQPVVDRLAPDFRVICLELPGFGFSHPGPGFGYTIDEQASALAKVLDHLGVRNATLEMACLGAFVGMRLAERRPDILRRLILLQVPSYHEARLWSRRADLCGIIATPWLGQVFMELADTLVVRHWYHAALPQGHNEATCQRHARLALEGFRRGGCFCLASAYQALQRGADYPTCRLGQETVVLWGSADQTHRHTDKQSIRRQIPQARVVEFEDCGHFPSLEATDRYLSIVQRTL